MLTNYLKIALRNLWRHRGFTVITVGGLAIGLAACLLIMQYVWFEKSYDRQSPYANDIWRIYTENYTNGTVESRDANSHSAIGPALKAEVPEVVDYTRIYSARDLAAFRGTTPLLQKSAYAVDEGFLRMFPYRTIYGRAEGALTKPNTILLTESTARRYFGNRNPVGQTLRLAGGWFTGLHTVTAVVEDVPPNTHFKFEMLLSYQTLYSAGHEDNWDNYWDYNYFQLRPDANSERVQAKLAELNEKYLSKSSLRLQMQPLTNIHLHSDLTYEHEPNGSARIVYFLVLLAVVILLIAWINYSNLTTARSLTRAKEVGLRKTIGAGRSQLIGQFLAEAFLINALAVGGAILLTQSFGATFDELTGRPLSGSGFAQTPFYAGVLVSLFVLSVLGSGTYPALVLSGYRPLSMLQGSFARSGQGVALRRVLVVVQLVCTVVMLVATMTIYRQLIYIEHHDLGLTTDQMLVVKAPLHDYREDSIYQTRFDIFRAEAEQLPGVQQMATSSVVPGDGINQIGGTSEGVYWKKNITDQKQTFYFVNVDEHFMDTYGVKRLAGESFRGQSPQWRSRYIINRAALKAMGFSSPEAAVGEALVFGGSEASRENDKQIVGVVEDFHIESLKQPTRPTLYLCAPSSQMSYFSLKLDTRQYSRSIDQLGSLWKQLYPDSPFEYFFLDQKFDEQYRAERRFSWLFSLFTGLAVLVACLGLFGLAAFTAEQRTKEIGIRKVLGASVKSIIALLSRDFLVLVLIAIVVATPMAWYVMDQWLQDFAYRITLSWWVFLAAGVLTAAIALLTVSFQSIKAALTNPVKSLRSE
ncbi:ABC transporter permease [Telluribacter sp.]|jgi:putative ABC transport system permease protein|uniref:ABC transporter permease n=1 Tax=Telluribacter sp. TaxID=1978767 RepID=UPI002E0F4B92|nr:ABC transporter permease [Telluribacter sp.]